MLRLISCGIVIVLKGFFLEKNLFLLNSFFIVSVEYYLKGGCFNYAGSSNIDQDHSNFSTCWCTGIAIIPRTILSSLYYIYQRKNRKWKKKSFFLLLSPTFIFLFVVFLLQLVWKSYKVKCSLMEARLLP